MEFRIFFFQTFIMALSNVTGEEKNIIKEATIFNGIIDSNLSGFSIFIVIFIVFHNFLLAL